jgi:hypothetical protein
MNPNGYTRLGESERRLFRDQVKDMVDFPLVQGTYMYIESVIVVSGTGSYRCLEVWGNNDNSTTVGMVAGLSTPSHKWLPLPASERVNVNQNPTVRFAFELFPCSVVMNEWMYLEKSPPFVQWSGVTSRAPSGTLRSDVNRITIDPKTGTCLLYAPGMVNPPTSFRDPAGLASVTPAPGSTSSTSSNSSSAAASTGAPISTTVMIAVGVCGGVVVLLLVIAVVAAASRSRVRRIR